MRRLLLFFTTILFSLGVSGTDTTKPWTFWYWMYGAVSEKGIKADLQAMKDVGLGGCYLMPIRGTQEKPEYNGEAQQLSPRFWEMVDYAMQQSDSLALEMGIHVCDGFALAGGPWISPRESMQKVVSMQTNVTGGTGKRYILMQPAGYEGYYEDIACFAIPSDGCPLCINPASAQPVITYSPTVTRDEKGIFRASEPGWIQYEYPDIATFRSVEIVPSGNNIQSQRLRMLASADGKEFTLVKQFEPPRQGWQNTDYNFTYTIPKTDGRYFRFEWTPEGTEPGAEDLDAAKWKPVLRLRDIRLSDAVRLNQWEGKSGLVWRIAPETSAEEIPDEDCAKIKDILRIEIKNGRLAEPLPDGNWLIVRIGHTSTGHTNATAGGGKGLECDKFSEAAVRKQVASWFGEFKKRPFADVVKYMHVDSWECGSQNWSKNFAEEFQKRRGYDLIPWLPVMVGIPIESAAKSEQVLRDVRQTIDELKNEVFFKTVRDCAHEYGVQLSTESVAPTMMSDGMSHYRYADIPMGEFWLNSPTHDKPNDMLDAISGAHVYGKNIIQAEGFTEVRGVWDETPAMVKPLLDRNFALGMNRLFFHVNTHNPWLDKKPGMTLDGIGLFFQRDQTWFPEAKTFVDYITCCQTLLQKGKPVIDIAVYTGEEMPSRALTPDKVVPMLPGLFGAERVASERKRLANVGQPMEESPVGVRHSANILDLKDWVNPLHGYQYDSMNKDALLTQPFNYKVLVIPEGALVSEEAKAKISQLRLQGVQIIDKPYQETSLKGIAPDVVLPEGIAYTHRIDDEYHIYFLANQTDKAQQFSARFRDADIVAVLYHPVKNTYSWSHNNKNKTSIDIHLAPYESVFVIFGARYNCVALALVKESYGRAVLQNSPIDANSQKDDFLVYDYSQDGNNSFPGWEQNIPKVGINALLWDVSFRESGLSLTRQPLFDWSQHENDKIRYFSGHARYTTTLKLKAKELPQGRAWLSFPNVKDIAHVWINGKDCGIAWTAPYEVEITGALKKGKNKIEIEVVNTWHNALRGQDQGKAPYEGIWTNAKYRTKGDGLLPAGLLEPPMIITTTN